ncbi:MAG: GAF and HD-GYP domain-containing protein [Actinomycetota bacterium]
MHDQTFVLVTGDSEYGAKSDKKAFPRERRMSDLAHDLGAMQEATDLPDLYAGLARAVVGALRADACLVSLLDESSGVLKDVAASVVPPARLNVVAEEHLLDDFPLTRQVIDTGTCEEISIGDERADENERRFLRELGMGRVLISALNVEGRAVGTVEAYRVQDRPFRHDDGQQVEVLCAFASNSYSRIQLASKLETHYTETIAALMSALEARDPYTEAHTGRISDMALALAVAMQVPVEVRRAVKLGAILHDVGKIGISDTILSKTGPLTEEEWTVMRTHPEIGERMLEKIDFVRPALPIIKHHHERWDGEGYPAGLQGEMIPVGARIVAVCDAFDAMTSDRPYRRALPAEEASRRLLACAGTQFDPACAALLVDVISKMGEDHLAERFVRYAS